MRTCAPIHTNTAYAGTRGGTIQTQLSQTKSIGGLGIFHYYPNNARYQLIRFIIVHQLPFLLGEDRHFERFFREAFVPSWQKISRVIARNDTIKTFLNEKESLK